MRSNEPWIRTTTGESTPTLPSAAVGCDSDQWIPPHGDSVHGSGSTGDYLITVELILVRHALPERREVTDGPADPALSEAGRAQARHLADYLADEHIDALYASPLRRALETIEPIAAAKNLPWTVVDGVAEWDRDSNEYVPVEELKASNDPRWRDIISGAWTSEEIPEEFARRVISSMESIIADHPGQTSSSRATVESSTPISHRSSVS